MVIHSVLVVSLQLIHNTISGLCIGAQSANANSLTPFLIGGLDHEYQI